MQALQPQVFALPAELSRISAATIVSTSMGQFLIAYDDNVLFTYPILSKSSTLHLQKFNIPFIKEIVSLTRSYFMITTQYSFLGIFQLNVIPGDGCKVEFTVIKDWKVHKSYFIREVVDNMIELQICEDDGVEIYQFTVNGKMGLMSYSLGQQYKIKKMDRRQLYGSKSFLNPAKKSICYLKNFSDKQFTVVKAQTVEKTSKGSGSVLLAYVGISKTQEYMGMFSNFMVVNLLRPQQKHKIISEVSQMSKIQKSFTQLSIESKNHFQEFSYDKQQFKVSQCLDLVLIQDKQNEVAYIYQIKYKGSLLIGVEHGKYDWFWAAGRRLIGLDEKKTCFKYVQAIRISQKNSKDQGQTIGMSDSTKNFEPHEFSSISNFIDQQGKSENLKQQDKQIEEPQISKKSIPQTTNNETKEEAQPHLAQKKDETPKEATTLPPSPETKYEQSLPKSAPYQRFKPTKVIQKGGKVSVSKTVQKSKQIEPLHQKPCEVLPDSLEQKKIQQTITKNITQILEEDKKIRQKKAVQKPIDQPIDIKKEEPATNSIYKFDFSKIGLTNNDKLPHLPHDKTPHENVAWNLFNTKINRAHIFSTENKPQLIEPPTEKPKQNPFIGSLIHTSKPNSYPQSFQPFGFQMFFGQDINIKKQNPLPTFSSEDKSQSIFDQIFAQPPKRDKEKDKETRIFPDISHSQDENEDFNREVRQLFDKTTGSLHKSIEEFPSKVKLDLHISDKISKQIGEASQKELKEFVSKEMTNKIQSYFREIAQDTDRIYTNTLEFYQESSKSKLTNLQIQFDHQQRQVHQIHDISTMLKSSLSSALQQSQQSTLHNLGQWRVSSKAIQKSVHSISEACTKYEDSQAERKVRYEEIYQNLVEIKNMLREEHNEKAAKKAENEKRNAEKIKLLLQKEKERERQKQKLKEKSKVKNKLKTKKQENVDMKKGKISKSIVNS